MSQEQEADDATGRKEAADNKGRAQETASSDQGPLEEEDGPPPSGVLPPTFIGNTKYGYLGTRRTNKINLAL